MDIKDKNVNLPSSCSCVRNLLNAEVRLLRNLEATLSTAETEVSAKEIGADSAEALTKLDTARLESKRPAISRRQLSSSVT